MNYDDWFELKAIADILRGEIAVAEVKQTITNPADLAELRRMLEEARNFLSTPGDLDDHHEPPQPAPRTSGHA